MACKYHVCAKNAPIFISSWSLSHKFQTVNPLAYLKFPLGCPTKHSGSSFPTMSTYSFPFKREICHPAQPPPSSLQLVATPFFWLLRWRVASSLTVLFLLVLISQENLLAGPWKHIRFPLFFLPPLPQHCCHLVSLGHHLVSSGTSGVLQYSPNRSPGSDFALYILF